MHTDDDFLRKLLDSPADDTVRLVYADWLDEQSDDRSRQKATFLRMTVAVAKLGKKQRQRRKLALRQLQQLAAELDTNWLAVVSRLKVENCGAKQINNDLPRYGIAFDFLCDRRWDEMTPTDQGTVRFCNECKQNVHYCDTIMTARQHAYQGHCVAVDLGIIRRDGDLEAPRMLLGVIAPDYARQEEERMKPDPVSQAREDHKNSARETYQ